MSYVLTYLYLSFHPVKEASLRLAGVLSEDGDRFQGSLHAFQSHLRAHVLGRIQQIRIVVGGTNFLDLGCEGTLRRLDLAFLDQSQLTGDFLIIVAALGSSIYLTREKINIF